LTHGQSGFLGRDRNCWPLIGNVQQVMSEERRNTAIAPYDLLLPTLSRRTMPWTVSKTATRKHPNGSVAAGERFIKATYGAIRSSHV
jgi:hypothetical protein